jgi:hypothetical protein
MIRQDASLAMNRAAEVTILSILLHNWICIQGQAVLGLHLALGFDLADYSFNLSSLFQSWLRRPEISLRVNVQPSDNLVYRSANQVNRSSRKTTDQDKARPRISSAARLGLPDGKPIEANLGN